MHIRFGSCYYEINSKYGRQVVTLQTEAPDTVCPVARSLDIVGDRWTLLVIRELFMGTSRFEEIQIQTKATPQMLTARLKSRRRRRPMELKFNRPNTRR